MLVRDWMSTKLITVDAGNSMLHATKLLKQHGIRMLPVMKDDRLVGVVTDRDLKRASASDATTLEVHELLYLLSDITVGDIMTKEPVTVPYDFTVEEAAEVLLKNKISGTPVVDRANRVVGVITQTDLFRAIISLTGLQRKGVQFALQVSDTPGSVKHVTDTIRQYGGRMASVLTSYGDAPEGFRKVFITMYNIDRQRLFTLKKDLQEQATLLYVVDRLDNRREIYDNNGRV